jgi:hypothetical protein
MNLNPEYLYSTSSSSSTQISSSLTSSIVRRLQTLIRRHVHSSDEDYS